MKAIVSVIGRDRTGIIAKVAYKLYEMNINIEDISQTVMQNAYFTMIMMISLGDDKTVSEVNDALQSVAQGHFQFHAQNLGGKICSIRKR